MDVRHTHILVFVSALMCADASFAEDVEVVAKSAKVKVQDMVVGSVEQAERFHVLQRKGAWVAIRVKTAEGARDGWVLASQVRTVVAPTITEDTPAPAAPTLIELGVNLTQFTQGSKPFVHFELSITNRDAKLVSYNVSDFNLEVDGEVIKFEPRSAGYYGTIYADEEMRSTRRPQYLSSGEISPGSKVTGWLRFEVPRFRRARELLVKKWILAGTVDGKRVTLDLKKTELTALGAKLHRSPIDPAFQVLEIGSRMNALNIGKVAELLGPVVANKQNCVVVLRNKKCLVDSHATRELQSILGSLARTRDGIVFVGLPRQLRYRFGYYPSSSPGDAPNSPLSSETTAIMQILGRRRGAGPALAKHLTNPSPETRLAAARALVNRTTEQGVVEALVRAVADEDAGVRIAAIRALAARASESHVLDALLTAEEDQAVNVRTAAIAALGRATSTKATTAILKGATDANASIRLSAVGALASRASQPDVLKALLKAEQDSSVPVRSAAIGALGRAKDTKATAAILKSMTDENLSIRIVAVRAAGDCEPAAVIGSLVKSLDDSQYTVASTACGVLGTLKAKDAVPKLRELHTGKNVRLKLPAGIALKAIGAITDIELALTKLEAGASSTRELELLGKSKDKRVVSKLVELLKYRADSNFVERVAKVLGEIGDVAAVEPLIQTFVYRSGSTSTEIPRALGKLGDKQAIKPLQQALNRPNRPLSSSRRMVIYEALLALEAPGMLEQLTVDLKEKKDSSEAGQIIGILGRAGGKQTIPTIKPFLDDPRHYQIAATTLVNIATPEAMEAIKARLLSQDYKYGTTVMSQLARKPTPEVVAIFRDLVKSPNTLTKSNAQRYLASIERTLDSQQLSQLQLHVRKKEFDAAEEAFQAIIKRQLERISKEPALAQRFSSYVNSIQSVYRRAGQPGLAEAQLEKTVAELESKVKDKAAPELTAVLRELRGLRILSLMQSSKTDEAEQILNSELAATQAAFKANGDDAAVVLRLDNLMGLQVQLLSKTAPEKAAAARENHLGFLSEQAKKHPNDAQVVGACFNANFKTLSGLARTNPAEAEKLLKSFKEFVGVLDSNDPVIQSRIRSSDNFFKAIERYIEIGKKRSNDPGTARVPRANFNRPLFLTL